MHEVPNLTVPNWITLNQTIPSQTKACLAKFSLVDGREDKHD
jgi:hypothetical protein